MVAEDHPSFALLLGASKVKINQNTPKSLYVSKTKLGWSQVTIKAPRLFEDPHIYKITFSNLSKRALLNILMVIISPQEVRKKIKIA